MKKSSAVEETPLTNSCCSAGTCTTDINITEKRVDSGEQNRKSTWTQFIPVSISFGMLAAGLIADNVLPASSLWFKNPIRFIFYLVAYFPVGLPVLQKAARLARKGEVFTEFLLMSLASLGAFYLGEYPEGVAVMVFYTIGERLQDAAVNRAKRSIKALLDIRPATAFVKRQNAIVEAHPETVQIGETILVRPGEKVPLDAIMLSEGSSFDTSALTGESRPTALHTGDPVLAGMINLNNAVALQVSRAYQDSSLARILQLVQEASTKKAKTEQFIRTFSRIYTPLVVVLATAITVLPFFFVEQYSFNQWFYRALIFLVISCPCALVISIPLGYFGGIGAASRQGILFKGSNFLDLMTKVNVVVFDKTGTLTKGVFNVQEVRSIHPTNSSDWLAAAAALETHSTHPVAKAIVRYAAEQISEATVTDVTEISGQGLKGKIDGQEILAGNAKLLETAGIPIDNAIRTIPDTLVLVAIDRQLMGYIRIADEIKEDSKAAIQLLHQLHIKTIMLSGDKQEVVDSIGEALGIDQAIGNLLPEDKVHEVQKIKTTPHASVAFVGDGINDAPVLALSDVGVAMGGLGSDAAIETADVVIQTDQPSRIARAIAIGKATNKIVWQNITLAFGVKILVMVLGAGGLASMWEAVFADVGVALLAILNAIRIQRTDW